MKTLAIIWGAVLITALGTGAYVNAAINENVARSQAEQLQPAATVQELQPALGYKALEWHVDHLEVR